MAMKDGILHLFNTYKWYDMIERGEKPEEYRDIEVWKGRICRYGNAKHVGQNKVCTAQCPFFMPMCRVAVPTDITHICFHRGYSSTTMLWKVASIAVGHGDRKLGAPEGYVFIIRLKERIKSNEMA